MYRKECGDNGLGQEAGARPRVGDRRKGKRCTTRTSPATARPRAASAPCVEHVPVDEAYGGDAVALFGSPGQADHAPAANPLHHPLRSLDLRADPPVVPLERAAPAVQLVGADVGREGHHAGDAVDGGKPEIDGTAEGGIADDRPALGDVAVGLGVITLETGAVDAVETGGDLGDT